MRNPTQQFATIVLLISSILLSAITVAGQEGNDWSRVNSVPAGSKLSVKLRSGKTVDGVFETVSDTKLSLTVKQAPMEIQRGDILSIHQVIRKSATTATLVGLGVGAGAGAAVGAVGDSNNDGFEKIDHAVTAGLAVVGAGAGALAGFLIGRKQKKRVLIYQGTGS